VSVAALSSRESYEPGWGVGDCWVSAAPLANNRIYNPRKLRRLLAAYPPVEHRIELKSYA